MVWNLLVWISAAQLSAGLAAQAQAPANANAPSDQQAQIEKGRQAVGEACATCHTNILRMVQIYKKSPDQWKDTVYSMIGRGAQLRPDEIEAVTAFLAATSGRSLDGECRRQTGRRRSGSGRQSHPATELPAMPRFGDGNDKIGFGGLERRHRKNDDLWSQSSLPQTSKNSSNTSTEWPSNAAAFPVLLANVLPEM